MFPGLVWQAQALRHGRICRSDLAMRAVSGSSVRVIPAFLLLAHSRRVQSDLFRSPRPSFFFSSFKFNVYMQPYAYDRNASTFPLTPSQMTPFFLHSCIVSPPAVRRRDTAFGLPALLILSLVIKVIYRQIVPSRLDLLSDSALPSYPLPLLDPLSR